jgi:hypothetical protein
MFSVFVPSTREIYWPRRLGAREPSFWRGLALMGLIAAAGLALSVLAGLHTPSEQLTTIEEIR